MGKPRPRPGDLALVSLKKTQCCAIAVHKDVDLNVAPSKGTVCDQKKGPFCNRHPYQSPYVPPHLAKALVILNSARSKGRYSKDEFDYLYGVIGNMIRAACFENVPKTPASRAGAKQEFQHSSLGIPLGFERDPTANFRSMNILAESARSYPGMLFVELLNESQEISILNLESQLSHFLHAGNSLEAMNLIDREGNLVRTGAIVDISEPAPAPIFASPQAAAPANTFASPRPGAAGSLDDFFGSLQGGSPATSSAFRRFTSALASPRTSLGAAVQKTPPTCGPLLPQCSLQNLSPFSFGSMSLGRFTPQCSPGVSSKLCS